MSSSESPFCEYYKPLLVEELALYDHPAHVHFGKCAVIGRIDSSDNILESLSIPDLPTRLQLPDGSSCVDIDLNNFHGLVPRGRHVEITGIVKLIDLTEHISTNSGMLRSNLLSTIDFVRYQHEYERMKTNYRPFVEVDHVQTIGYARELIACNLKMRKLKLPNDLTI